uniref:Uncharacterized protein n=1 Tax=Felis catus TaxID=9685 RepID=A0ABI8ABY9_FELCA
MQADISNTPEVFLLIKYLVPESPRCMISIHTDCCTHLLIIPQSHPACLGSGYSDHTCNIECPTAYGLGGEGGS